MRNKRIVSIIIFILLIIILIPTVSHATKPHEIINEGTVDKLGELKEYIGFLTNIVIAFALTSSVLIFIIHFIKLGKHSSNPNKRSETLNNLLVSGIATAMLGGIGLFTKLLLAIF